MKLFGTKSGETRKKEMKSLSRQITAINAASLIFAIVIASTISAACMAGSARKIAQESAAADLEKMENSFEEIASGLIQNGTAMAFSEPLISALDGTGTPEAAKAKLETLAGVFGVDEVTLFSSDLRTVASTGGYGVGAKLDGVERVNEIFSGAPVSATGASASYDYAVNAVVPVYVNGGVAGGILLTEDLADSAFVDNMKQLTGNEYTIFLGNTRLITTLTDGKGARIVGTSMNEEIAETVLNRRENYVGRATIAENPYYACYAPILSADGAANGALFAGYSLTSYYDSIKWSVVIVAAAAVVLSVLVCLYNSRFLKRRMKRPLDRITASIQSFADGDMTERSLTEIGSIQINNEIGQMAACMGQAISDMAGNMNSIKEISTAINSRSMQVSESADTLAQGATEQASSVEELSSTVNSIVAQVNENAKNAAGASDTARDAENKVLKSNEQMESMMAAMREIYSTSQEIGAIVKTIDDLAFQTNILSLNAAVEAAHAGQQGRGFAVIADEVQNLAGKSADAAKNTQRLIENALSAVKKGTEYAGSVADSLKGVVRQTAQVNGMVAAISEAANSEAQLLYQVNESISQISTVVQTNSGIAEETAATSMDLEREAQQLSGMIRRYRLDDGSAGQSRMEEAEAGAAYAVCGEQEACVS